MRERERAGLLSRRDPLQHQLSSGCRDRRGPAVVSPVVPPQPLATPSSTSHPTVVLHPSSKMPLTQTFLPAAEGSPHSSLSFCLPPPFRHPQCRESSVAPLSSVCHRPRKRAVLLGAKCDRRNSSRIRRRAASVVSRGSVLITIRRSK